MADCDGTQNTEKFDLSFEVHLFLNTDKTIDMRVVDFYADRVTFRNLFSKNLCKSIVFTFNKIRKIPYGDLKEVLWRTKIYYTTSLY